MSRFFSLAVLSQPSSVSSSFSLNLSFIFLPFILPYPLVLLQTIIVCSSLALNSYPLFSFPFFPCFVTDDFSFFIFPKLLPFIFFPFILLYSLSVPLHLISLFFFFFAIRRKLPLHSDSPDQGVGVARL